jgi:UDP-N-acetyl-D-mannosaminuronic acid dehydrogenase
MAEGSALEEVASVPLVVAAEDEVSLERAKRLLASLGVRECISSGDFRLAELVKAVENASRDVNIAFANEVAALCRAIGVDTSQLISLANTHPRVKMLLPGPGVGGFCLPNAHHYLAHAAKQAGARLALTAEARSINDGVPLLVAKLLEEGLARANKRLAGAKVAVLGVGMKDFCGDDRLSPVYPLIERLEKQGAHVAAFDPAVRAGFPARVGSRDEAVTEADAVVIAARQDGLSLEPTELVSLMRPSPVIVDTKGALDRQKVEALGCVLVTL